jgi:hypothetical protein
MKTLTKILALAIVACLITSCEDPEDFSYPQVNKPVSTFEADFVVFDFSDYAVEYPKVERIEEPFLCQKHWEGNGVSAQMGDFSVKMTLLCNMVDLSFCNLIGTFETADGSVIFFSIEEGQMECNTGEHCDYYDFTFNNPAVIIGGTGRFAGISGGFHPNALIHNAPGNEWNAKFCCQGDIKFNSRNQSEVGPLIPEPPETLP